VHGAFAEMAISRPDIDFFVKTKWDGNWRTAFHQAVNSRDISYNDIPNLLFSDEGDVHRLILDSCCVIALNSTTALEAAVLGRPVIRPYYSDAAGSASDHMLFVGEDDGFIYAESENSLKFHIETMADSFELWRKQRMENGIKTFEKYVSALDGGSVARYSEQIQRVIEERRCA
jgi:hypothetical protein